MSQDVTATLEVGGEEVIRALTPRWQALCDEVHSAPFYRPEWISAYVHAFEPKSEIVLATASAAGRLVAVLPLVRKRCFYAGVPLVKLTGTANCHSIRFDILRIPGAIGDASIRALWKLLSDTPGWHVLELPLFPRDGACADLMRIAGEDGFPALMLLVQDSPILRLRVNGNGGPAQLIGGPSRHFRHELRRYARIFATETGAEPKVTRWSAPSAELLQQFFSLEEAGWKGREGSAINCDPETRTFYNRIAATASEGGYFSLHTLEAKGAMVAGAFSVSTKSGFYPMKIAHDESLRRGGPGHLLFNAIVAECAEEQIPELFFGGADEHYKTLWTRDTLSHFSVHVFSSDVRSHLAYQLRKRVVSPLGKLRRLVRERLNRDQPPSKRVGESTTKPKKAPLVRVPEPSAVEESQTPESVVHS